MLPTSEVKGVLKGMSRNASTTCTRSKGTGGPEALYLLTVRSASAVELRGGLDHRHGAGDSGGSATIR